MLIGQSQVHMSNAATVAAGVGTSASIRLATPQVRQRFTVAASTPQVLKVMTSQAGNIPQIITLGSARAPGIGVSVCSPLVFEE